jgi:DNA-binding transcriptional LysR family regulator
MWMRATMRRVHIENADLNLLKALAVLLEERHVSRAADRFHLSQSAMSRTLARLRDTFGDELLVRTTGGYELTARARSIQRELQFLLPRLNSLVRGGDFEPAAATDTVRVGATDYLTAMLGGKLFRQLFHQAPNLSLMIEPRGPHTYDDVENGRLDVVLSPVKPRRSLRWQTIFHEDYVCVLARDHPVRRKRLTVDDLAGYPHASVVVVDRESMVLEQRMRELGIQPSSGLRVPYFTAAAAALPGTTLIATLPRRFARRYADADDLRIAEAPAEIGGFSYGMIWHPRLDQEPVRMWLRGLIQDCADAIDDPD